LHVSTEVSHEFTVCSVFVTQFFALSAG
jgi:hypothetical protein